MPLLEIKGLKTHFFTEEGVVKAVDGFDLVVDRGEVVGIVGESGSGKSVASLSIMRLVADPPGKIVGGSIVLHGDGAPIDLVKASEPEMRKVRGNRVAMIFQDPMTSLNPYLKVSLQLTEVLEIHQGITGDAARQKSIAMLRSVGIPDPERRFDDYPHQLSGGMRQRVMIAIALLASPQLLIADEPTTALDVTIQAQILELIREQKDALGVGVLLITHDLGVVARLADRVAVMYAGRVVEQGTVFDIFEDPRHPYTVGLARSIPRLDTHRDGRLVPIPGMPPSPANLPSGCPFRARCPVAMPVCAERFPDERTIAPGHVVFCHETDPARVRGEPAEAATDAGLPVGAPS